MQRVFGQQPLVQEQVLIYNMRDIRYTKGLEFYTLDGLEYKGYYYIDSKNNVAHTYTKGVKYGKVLVPRHTFNTETARLRSKVKGGSMSPIPILPSPTDYDYTNKAIIRYFVQKKNSPLNTIIEIDETQYNKVRLAESNSFINSNIYNSLSIEWRIAGNEDYVYNSNKKIVEESESSFKGIKNFIKNYLQFYK